MGSSTTTTVTSKGQVTIPVEIRRRLGIQPRDQIQFDAGDGVAIIRRVSLTLEDVAGSVPPLSRRLSWKQIQRVVQDERAEQFTKQLSGRSKKR